MTATDGVSNTTTVNGNGTADNRAVSTDAAANTATVSTTFTFQP